MKDVRITVDLGSRRGQYEVSLQLDDNITCGETLQVLLDSLEQQQQGHSKWKRWQLVERWRGCDRIISSKELMVPLYMRRDRDEIKIYLKRRPLPSEQQNRRSIRRAKAIKHDIKSTPASVLFRRKMSWQKLSCLHWLLQRELRQRRKKYRDILYKRLARREPLWTPAELTPIDILRIELGRLKEHNLVLSSQVADLNITSTDLRSQLNLLRQKSLSLSEQLSKLEQQVKAKKEERDRQGPKNMTQVQTELIKLKRELEVRNRLNTSQNAKLKAQKQLLKEKQQLLAEKKQEVEKLKLKETANQQALLADVHTTKDARQSPDRAQISPGRGFNIRRTPPSSVRREQVMSSASKKRHSSIFEVKTRQLVEEESKAFRELSSKRLDFDDEIDGEDTTDPKQLQVDHKFIIDPQLQAGGLTVGHAMSNRGVQLAPKALIKSRQRQTTSPKHVQFTADSLILDAALEGDLDLLKQCTRKLGSCLKTSDKGATCLHNAVCSGNMDVVSYLVEQGCNVNAQDIDGWTPLHCAVAYTNLEMIRYLVQQGASLFMMSKDGETPLKIIAEEYKSQKEKEDSEKSSQLVACLHYLADRHRELGCENNGVVYTLFSRQAKDSDELGFTDGEKLTVLHRSDDGQWWLAENRNGKQGLVPCTFLGPYKPSNLGTLL